MSDSNGRTPSGRYTILGAIHRGGMGQILLARQEGAEGFNRKLVLKGLLPQLSFDEVSVDLFRREAQIMARLEHPNIVRVVDFTYVDDKPYLAMEYVRGRNLHQIIQRAGHRGASLPAPVAMYAVAEALHGLHYAHLARGEDGQPLGIIHRDISPGNILLSFFGEVKVADFGIAMLADAKKYTAPKSIRGKARYAAPEVVRGHAATVQSDVHSAGVVLAESLMGEPLFERGSVAKTLMSIVTEKRDETLDRIFDTANVSIPGLEDVLRRALALEPKDRHPSAAAFAEELEEIYRGYGGTTQSELGQYLCELFVGDADLPRDGGVIDGNLPAISFVAELVTPIDAKDAVEQEPPTPVERPSHFSDQPTIRQRFLRPGEPESLARTARPTRPQTRPPRPAIAPPPPPEQPRQMLAAPLSDDSAAYNLSELVVARRETWEESSRSLPDDPLRDPRRAQGPKALLANPWVLLMLGILIGAATALTGSLLALMTG